MKKIREEVTEYWQTETGRVIVKIEEKFLASEKDGEEERWVSYNKSIPLV